MKRTVKSYQALAASLIFVLTFLVAACGKNVNNSGFKAKKRNNATLGIFNGKAGKGSFFTLSNDDQDQYARSLAARLLLGMSEGEVNNDEVLRALFPTSVRSFVHGISAKLGGGASSDPNSVNRRSLDVFLIIGQVGSRDIKEVSLAAEFDVTGPLFKGNVGSVEFRAKCYENCWALIVYVKLNDAQAAFLFKVDQTTGVGELIASSLGRPLLPSTASVRSLLALGPGGVAPATIGTGTGQAAGGSFSPVEDSPGGSDQPEATPTTTTPPPVPPVTPESTVASDPPPQSEQPTTDNPASNVGGNSDSTNPPQTTENLSPQTPVAEDTDTSAASSRTEPAPPDSANPNASAAGDQSENSDRDTNDASGSQAGSPQTGTAANPDTSQAASGVPAPADGPDWVNYLVSSDKESARKLVKMVEEGQSPSNSSLVQTLSNLLPVVDSKTYPLFVDKFSTRMPFIQVNFSKTGPNNKLTVFSAVSGKSTELMAYGNRAEWSGLDENQLNGRLYLDRKIEKPAGLDGDLTYLIRCINDCKAVFLLVRFWKSGTELDSGALYQFIEDNNSRDGSMKLVASTAAPGWDQSRFAHLLRLESQANKCIQKLALDAPFDLAKADACKKDYQEALADGFLYLYEQIANSRELIGKKDN